MDVQDLELLLFVCLSEVLIQALIECKPTYSFDDDVVIDAVIQGITMLESYDIQLVTSVAALHDYHLAFGLICFNNELRFWLKPRSIVWFSDFLISVYDDSRWIEYFRMDKAIVGDICYKLYKAIEKADTKYCLAILVKVRVCACLYKLAHGTNLLTCSEKFPISRSIVGLVLREVVMAINTIYDDAIQWLRGDKMWQVMVWIALCSWCHRLYTHPLGKPKTFPEDYYYYKTGGYTVIAQVVVDSKKQFTQLFVGLLGSVNDQRVLRRSSLW
jgi:hypothetical protein